MTEEILGYYCPIHTAPWGICGCSLPRQDKESSKEFITEYTDMLSGSWAKKWIEYQDKDLPKHRINNKHNDLRCTCGAGPFSEMLEWAKHANERKSK